MLTTQEKIEAWEKVQEEIQEEVEAEGICILATRLYRRTEITWEQHIFLIETIRNSLTLNNNNYPYLFPLDAFGMASRRAFIQGKIDELRKELSPEQSKEVINLSNDGWVCPTCGVWCVIGTPHKCKPPVLQ